MTRPAPCHPDKRHHAKGLCLNCYMRLNRHRLPSQSPEIVRERLRQWRIEHADEERERKRQWRRDHREAENKRAAEWTKAHPEWRKEWEKKYRAADPHRAKARAAVNNAIASGRLLRQPCEECGASKAEAHHYKGHQPDHYLAIRWLCRAHHKVAHGGVWNPVRKAA